MKNEKKIKPLISIITVVWNSEKLLEKTIQSIVNQTYTNIEYIIIDGGSTDSTLNIIQKYDSQIAFWSSEKDKGLYDAMNKGLAHAKGDYVWFINSGDKIYDSQTLEKMISQVETLPDVFYGETMIIAEDDSEIGMRRHKTPENLTWKSLIEGMRVCHQSIVVRKSIAPLYNLNYRYSSDYEWVIKVLKQAKNIQNTNLILSRFLDGGQTKRTIKAGLKERFRIMVANYGLLKVIFQHFVLAFRFIIFLIQHKRF